MAVNTVDKVLEDIVNRQPFKFDEEEDPLYKAYKQEYQELGEDARTDTLDDIAAISGGDAADYAQIAALQAQNTHRQQMNAILPALENAAYNRYKGQVQREQSNYGLQQDKDIAAYRKQRDAVADQQFRSESGWNKTTFDKDYSHEEKRDKVSDQQWKSEFGWKKSMDNKEYALKKKRVAKRYR